MERTDYIWLMFSEGICSNNLSLGRKQQKCVKYINTLKSTDAEFHMQDDHSKSNALA